jgi:Txe/YoeB family toxin of Txe-Axe toxin-antitoxin module
MNANLFYDFEIIVKTEKTQKQNKNKTVKNAQNDNFKNIVGPCS